MKKYYETPKLELLALLTGDVVTLSIVTAEENGGEADNEAGERSQAWRYE